MKVIFSTAFRQDLLHEQTRYSSISVRLGEEFHERVKEVVRTIVNWEGGDHVGPHGFPCRRCRPFPFYVYYEIREGTLYVLGLVQERRHPDHLRKRLMEEGD